MPERVCCNTEFLPFKLLRSARVAVFRLIDPDRYGAIIAVREARLMTGLLAVGHNRRLLVKSEAAVYTRLQSALKGKARISPNSLLSLAAGIFMEIKKVAGAVYAVKPGPRGRSSPIPALMNGASELLSCLELQISAVSDSGVRFYVKRFYGKAAELREELRAARVGIHCGDDGDCVPGTATALAAFETFLSAAEKTAYAAAKSARRRRTGYY